MGTEMSKTLRTTGFLAAALILGLSACQSVDVSKYDADPAFHAGYADGCRTGNTRLEGFKETVARDDAAWERSEAYRVGWRRGYGACGDLAGQDNYNQDFLQTDRFDQGPI